VKQVFPSTCPRKKDAKRICTWWRVKAVVIWGRMVGRVHVWYAAAWGERLIDSDKKDYRVIV